RRHVVCSERSRTPVVPPTAARILPRQTRTAAMVASPEKHKNYSILITDDDSNSRGALRDVLRTEGFETFEASCGEEAVDVVQVKPVHLMLMDMHMPTLSGLDTLPLVRQLHAELS